MSRQVPPALFEFLYVLSKAQGADPTRAADTNIASAPRNGEPNGEIGLVTQRDGGLWQKQSGAPADPQAGNIPGGKRDAAETWRAPPETSNTPESTSKPCRRPSLKLAERRTSPSRGRRCRSRRDAGSPASAVGSIVDNDGPSTVAIAASDASGSEQGSDPIVYTITRTGNVWSTIVVNLGWSGTAVLGTDYTVSASGGTLSASRLTLTLTPGVAQATVTVAPVDDATAEPAETVVLTVKSGTGYSIAAPSSAAGSIADNDVAPPPTVSIAAAVSVSEGNSGTKTVSLTLTLSAAAFVPTGVSWPTANGTATAGSDYLAASGTVTFAAGVRTATIVVTILGDTTWEPSETFTVTLSSPQGLVPGNATATVTVTNDDSAPTFTLAVSDSSASEASRSTGMFTITRSGNLNGAITLGLAWGGTAAFPADYELVVAGGTLSADRTTLTMASGVGKATITVKPFDDTSVEGTETVTLALVAGAAYLLKSPTAGTISIADNDKALLAAATAPAGSSPRALTEAELAPVVRLAQALWIAAVPGADFTDVTVEVADLEGALLGVTSGRRIVIDATAAGWGWAPGRGMDLLTVLLHELGHALGLDHDDDGPMAETLAAGVRYAWPVSSAAPGRPSSARPGLIRPLRKAAPLQRVRRTARPL